MAKKQNKSTGSLIPSILKLEQDLHELEMQEKSESEGIIKSTEQEIDTLVAEIQQEVESLEQNERETLLKSVNAEITVIENTENDLVSLLKKAVENNSERTVEFIIQQILPNSE